MSVVLKSSQNAATIQASSLVLTVPLTEDVIEEGGERLLSFIANHKTFFVRDFTSPVVWGYIQRLAETYIEFANERRRSIFGLITEMEYIDLPSVPDDYDDPEQVPSIAGLVSCCSYVCRHNGTSGVYDYMLNLAMLDSDKFKRSIHEKDYQVFENLKELGVSWVLLNQGC